MQYMSQGLHTKVHPCPSSHTTSEPLLTLPRDALRRHELTHRNEPSLLQRGIRACLGCASAKARCSGEQQCIRCRDRGSDCVFPDALPLEDVSDSPRSEVPIATSSSAFDAAPGTGLSIHAELERPPVVQQVLHTGPLLQNLEMSVGADAFLDSDFWDPNVLATTNWLGTLDESSFTDFALPQAPFQGAWAYPPTSPLVFGLNGGQTGVPTPRSAAFSAPLESTVSPAGQSDAATESGDFYVDGEPARRPHVKRRRLSSTVQSCSSGQPQWQGFSLRCPASANLNPAGPALVAPHVYEQMESCYKRLCLDPPRQWAAFEPCDFPSIDAVTVGLELYEKHFDQASPFLHPSEMASLAKGHDFLVPLACCSLGFQYAADLTGRPFCISLQEFLRRALIDLREDASRKSQMQLETARAHYLNLIGMAYSGNSQMQTYALQDCRALVEIFSIAQSHGHIATNGPSLDEEWDAWCRRESALRLAHSAWLLDCMWTYQFQSRPVFRLGDADFQLPCSEKLWHARSAQAWLEAGGLGAQPAPPTLTEALQELYIEKRCPRERGEFARILVIHGLYHRSWGVERYFSDPLSAWDPTATRQSSSEVLPPSPMWLPSVPTFVKWQNSACDALDVLHWQANATIGQACGLEHPTVMHLHFARIVLLAPYEQILRLARSITDLTPQQDDAKASSDMRSVQRWAVQHQYKARLSIIHAGVVFWHVRRHSVDGFYEAPAVALAALTLWAFGTFGSRQPPKKTLPAANDTTTQTTDGPTSQTNNDTDGSDDLACPIILLDRPTDDELVQQFIRKGHTMQAHLTGVGDLYGPHGPQRVLAKACTLLSGLRCWGVNEMWVRLLQKLSTTSLRAEAL